MKRRIRLVQSTALVVLLAAALGARAAPAANGSSDYWQFLPIIIGPPAHWRTVDTGLQADLNSVFSRDGVTGWVVGNDGTIARTDDAGEHWTPQQSGTDSHLYDVFFRADGQGWAVGRNVILHSANGGEVWEAVSSPVETIWRAVGFVDRDHGWIMGGHVVWVGSPYFFGWYEDYGYILRTSNGGQSWALANDDLCEMNDFWFADAANGWAVSTCSNTEEFAPRPEGTKVVASTDAGDTWQTLEVLGLHQMLRSIAFTDAGRGWAVGSFDTALSTADGGLTWSTGSIGTGADWVDVEFVSADTGWVLSEASILHTTNGGRSWEAESLDRAPQGLSDLHAVGPQAVWAVGDGGAVYIRR